MNILKEIAYSYIIPFIGMLNNRKNRFVNIIYYHDIVRGNGKSFQQTNIELFKCQMEYITRQGYKTLRFDNLNDDTLGFDSKSVIIAFDDGWASNYYEIYDFMRNLDLKYNIYLAVDKIGSSPDYLTWDIIRKMHDEGNVGFGVHTFNHVDVSDLTKIDPSVEFEQANKRFKDELGYTPLDFCYPFGAYSEASNSYLIENTPYVRLHTSRLMYSYRQDGKIVFGRCGISNEESMRVFRAKLKGYMNIWTKIIG